MVNKRFRGVDMAELARQQMIQEAKAAKEGVVVIQHALDNVDMPVVEERAASPASESSEGVIEHATEERVEQKDDKLEHSGVTPKRTPRRSSRRHRV